MFFLLERWKVNKHIYSSIVLKHNFNVFVLDYFHPLLPLLLLTFLREILYFLSHCSYLSAVGSSRLRFYAQCSLKDFTSPAVHNVVKISFTFTSYNIKLLLYVKTSMMMIQDFWNRVAKMGLRTWDWKPETWKYNFFFYCILIYFSLSFDTKTL